MTSFFENLKRHNRLQTSIELQDSLIYTNYDLKNPAVYLDF